MLRQCAKRSALRTLATRAARATSSVRAVGEAPEARSGSVIRTPDVAPVRAKRRAPLFKPPFVLSLDLGVKKIAYCLFSTVDKRIVEWKRVDLEDAGGINSANVEDVVDYFDAFMLDNAAFFERDCHVLIENQVSARLRVIQAVAYAVFRSRATTQILNPRRVRQHFDISTGTWAKNKKASVLECERRLLSDTAPDEAVRWTQLLQTERKQDDLADCFLQALYWRQMIWNETA